uniref:C2H2-type domain-containing protein n=1 Tax=viral metagenome TaxID=1070528 RepID=A0A6C0IM99_9ZZZZ
MEVENSPKLANRFSCEKCHYMCRKESDFNKHLSTRKHNGNKMTYSGNSKIAYVFACDDCNKSYKTSSGLWKHKKICSFEEENITISNQPLDTSSSEMKVLSNLIMEMVKSNSELQKQNCDLQKQVLDVCKNSNTNTINSNNNNNNKTFNLQFFLNEQCKDAMNISDFANSINLQLSDFESVGELGYVEGITKIMLDRLNSMDIYKRPIHCSDAKREILYVKDDDKWEKEEKNNPKLRYAIKTVSFNNMKLMGLWSSTYPESMDGESRLNDKYMTLIKQSTGGNGEISDSEDKIIRRIAKEILIDKK